MAIIRIFLLIGGILLLLNIRLMLNFVSFNIGLAAQGAIALCVIAYAVFFNKISRKIHIALLALASIPIAIVLFLGIYGNISNADYTEDVVIVLGAGVIGETVTRPLAHRLNAAADYWHQNPESVIIVTGGLGNRAIITEAEAMARFLTRRGVPSEAILLEDQSTSTYENLYFAKAILNEHFPDGFRAVLITNDFHIYRSVRMAGQIGMDVNHIGTNTDWYTWPVNYLREMLAVLHFWVF